MKTLLSDRRIAVPLAFLVLATIVVTVWLVSLSSTAPSAALGPSTSDSKPSGVAAPPSTSVSSGVSGPSSSPSAPISIPSASAGPTPTTSSTERSAVPPANVSTAAAGPTVAIKSIDHVNGVAVSPGDLAGPAVRLTILVTNTTKSELDLRYTAVNAYLGSARTPAVELSQPGGMPFHGRLKPGESGTGTYLFVVPAAQRADATLVVDYAAGQPAAVFSGAF